MIKSELVAAIKDLDPDANPRMHMTKAALEQILSTLQTARALELVLSPAIRIRSRQEVFEDAWRGKVATVRSMGRTVRGRVIDAVTRVPLPFGSGAAVCLVIQHDNHPTRRTMHSFSHVKLS
jgi:hypothetical protein